MQYAWLAYILDSQPNNQLPVHCIALFGLTVTEMPVQCAAQSPAFSL